MAGTKNDVLVGKNADFTQVAGPNSGSSESNGLISDGDLWIGTTSVNVGGTHINVGTLTSPEGTINVGYSSPNITIDTAILQKVVTVTSPEIKSLNASPKVLISAPSAGKSIQLIGAQAKFIYGGNNVFTNPSDLQLTYDLTTGIFTSFIISTAYSVNYSTYNMLSIQAGSATVYPSTLVEGMPLMLFNPNPEVTGNAADDNEIVISLLYTIVTL